MTEAMLFLQNSIILSYDPRSHAAGIFLPCHQDAIVI